MLSDVVFFVHFLPPFVEIGDVPRISSIKVTRAVSGLSRVNKKEPLREKRLLDGSDHVAG
jgi:hypothetical protein